MAIPPVLNSIDETTQRCQVCGNMRQTRFVAFYRNVGMLFGRRTYTLMGNLCEECTHKTFWKFEALDIILGPWGMISAIMAPLYFVQNIFAYLGALYQFHQAQGRRDLPRESTFSVLKALAVIGAAVVVLFAILIAKDRQRAAAIFASASAQHRTEQILCGDKLKSVKLFSAPDLLGSTSVSLTCGEVVLPLAQQGDWVKLRTQKSDEGFLPKWYVGLPTGGVPVKKTRCNRAAPMKNLDQYGRLKTAIDGFMDSAGIQGKEFRDTTEDLASGAYFLAYLTAEDPGKAKAEVLTDAVNDPTVEDSYAKLSASEQNDFQIWYHSTLVVMAKAFDIGYKDGAKFPCNPE